MRASRQALRSKKKNEAIPGRFRVYPGSSRISWDFFFPDTGLPSILDSVPAQPRGDNSQLLGSTPVWYSALRPGSTDALAVESNHVTRKLGTRTER